MHNYGTSFTINVTSRLESLLLHRWLRNQFDILLYIDETTANAPLEGDDVQAVDEDDSPSGAPPTYPSGV